MNEDQAQQTIDAAQNAPRNGSADWLHGRTQTSADTPSSAVPKANGSLGMESIGRTSLGLIVVIALIFACSALLKRFGPYRKRGGRSLDIIASQSLGPRERVVVIEVEDTWLVLGVAPNSVNTLHTMPAGERDVPAETSPARPSNPSFGEAFAENLRRAGTRFTRHDGKR
ncbi:flagellar biosynthetic protein FliO [Salinisphaera sp. S4-8]|uniref:flagellar biosynthetic protein FliO n=1 Tax=Salinisphaera sp. S4-8 TaxID=633357 RepID=UPI0033407033